MNARTLVEKHVPGATTHPLLPEAMNMTLGEVASYAAAGINRSQLNALLEDLAKLEIQE